MENAIETEINANEDAISSKMELNEKRIFEILAYSGQIERYKCKPQIWIDLDKYLLGAFVGFVTGVSIGVWLASQI